MPMQSALHSGSFQWPVVVPSKHRLPGTHLLSGSIELMGATVPFARDAEIYGENEPAEYLYMVVSGAVRTYKVLIDGRRQICTFHMAGDFFGLEIDNAHAFSAEAIINSRILMVKRSALMTLAERDRNVARQLWMMTGDELRRVQAHVLLLIKTAKERVAAFLLEMAERMPDADEIDLPMSRQDVADYLGLTIETVSRTLTDLENKAVIALPSSRHVVLRDRNELADIAAEPRPPEMSFRTIALS